MIRKVSRASGVSLWASARGKFCCYASRFWSFGCGEKKSDEYQDIHAIIAISARYWLARISFVHILFLLALSILPVKQAWVFRFVSVFMIYFAIPNSAERRGQRHLFFFSFIHFPHCCPFFSSFFPPSRSLYFCVFRSSCALRSPGLTVF